MTSMNNVLMNNDLSKIRTILVHNSHPGNIGASARALKNMGLSALYLVAPKEFPSKEAEALASNAQDILATVKVFSTLEEALAGCTWVLGCSARQRKLSLPVFTVREASEKIIEHCTQFSGDIAILYGNEQHGLSNEELAMCAAQIVIPTAAEYASLNLAQAVQIVSYELFCAVFAEKERSEVETTLAEAKAEINFKTNLITQTLPNYEALEEFYRALEKVLIHIQYLDPKKPGQMMTRLKHIFTRAKLDKTELTILRGMLAAMGNGGSSQ